MKSIAQHMADLYVDNQCQRLPTTRDDLLRRGFTAAQIDANAEKAGDLARKELQRKRAA